MKISQKLILTFSGLVALVIFIGMASLFQLDRIAQPLNEDIPESIKTISRTSSLHGLAQFTRYYDEVLTQSARNYAFTQDKKWQQRYREIESELDRIIKSAILEGNAEDKRFFSSVDKANLALVDMEYRSIELVNNGQPQEAVKILESDEYWRQKDIYEQGLIDYVNRRGAEYHQALLASTKTIDSATARAQDLIRFSTLSVLVFVIIALALSTVVSLYTFHSIASRLAYLKTATEEIGKGKLDTCIEVNSNDEIGQLANSFKKMTENLQKTTTSVDKLNKEITERKKTEDDLQKTVKELEQFNGLAVGRELQMVELKKEIDVLLCELDTEEKHKRDYEMLLDQIDGLLCELDREEKYKRDYEKIATEPLSENTD